jgi:ribosomal protein S18 acetylase RimI-like enzyme
MSPGDATPVAHGRRPASATGAGHDDAVTDIVLRPLEHDEHRAAAAVAARAFVDAPTTLAAYGDDLTDRLALPYADFSTFFKVLPGPQVGAFCGGCLIGVVGVSPPGECIGSFLRANAAEILDRPTPGLGDPSRVEVFWAQWALSDTVEEHWHVGPVAVEPGFQGRGIGRLLMRDLCSTLDGDARLAWLETDKERNVRFYIALGFDVAAATTILGVPTWFMHRRPQDKVRSAIS